MWTFVQGMKSDRMKRVAESAHYRAPIFVTTSLLVCSRLCELAIAPLHYELLKANGPGTVRVRCVNSMDDSVTGWSVRNLKHWLKLRAGTVELKFGSTGIDTTHRNTVTQTRNCPTQDASVYLRSWHLSVTTCGLAANFQSSPLSADAPWRGKTCLVPCAAPLP